MADIKNEIWKEISLNPNYLVSNYGRVKSIARHVNTKYGVRHKKEHFLTPRDIHGYLHVGFNNSKGKLVHPLVHRLVMYAFVGVKPYPKWEIDHINGDSHDNRLENLEYVTSSENSRRAIAMGLQTPESMSLSKKNRKMTPEQIIEMKHQFLLEKRVWGVGHNNIDFIKRYAEKYNMKKSSVQNILAGRTNRFFGEDIVQTTNNQKYLDIDNIPEKDENMTNRDYYKVIADLLGIRFTAIENHVYKNHKSIKEIVEYYNKKISNKSYSGKRQI